MVSTLPARVRRDLDLAAVTRLRDGRKPVSGKLQGLTIVEHRMDFKTAVAVTDGSPQSKSCAWLESLTVDLAGEATIYVPREYPEGSCEEMEVLRHERRHEEIHRLALEASADEARSALARATWLPTRASPLEVSDRREAERRLDEMVFQVIQPAYDGFEARLEEEQAAVDRPESYRRSTGRCRGWK